MIILARLIVAFVRHGEYQQPPGVPSAHLPYPLTQEGITQATDAAESINKMALDKGWDIYPIIDSSHQLRGWQTASIIASELQQHTNRNITVECYEQLAERCLGSAANLTVKQIESVITADPRFKPLPAGWKSDSNFKIPLQGAESLMQAGKRVMQHVTDSANSLMQDASADTLKIFIGHGAAFRHAAVHMGLMTTEKAVSLSMYHCTPLYFERIKGNSNNKKWQHIAGEWKIRKAKGVDLD